MDIFPQRHAYSNTEHWITRVTIMVNGTKPTGNLKGPIHDSDLQPQPQFPTATSTKFPVYGLQQPQPPPQLAGRGGGCSWSEFSDTWWAELKVAVEVAVVYGQKRSNMSHKHRYLHAFELCVLMQMKFSLSNRKWKNLPWNLVIDYKSS